MHLEEIHWSTKIAIQSEYSKPKGISSFRLTKLYIQHMSATRWVKYISLWKLPTCMLWLFKKKNIFRLLLPDAGWATELWIVVWSLLLKLSGSDCSKCKIQIQKFHQFNYYNQAYLWQKYCRLVLWAKSTDKWFILVACLAQCGLCIPLLVQVDNITPCRRVIVLAYLLQITPATEWLCRGLRHQWCHSKIECNV